MLQIDTREPDVVIKYLQKTYKEKCEFLVKKLDEGDFATTRCLFERKQIKDLYSSIMDGRLASQCCRLAQHEDKVIGLVIYGDIEEFKKEQRIKRKVFINDKIMTSAVAEMACRYNLIIIWAEEYKVAFSLMVNFMLDVDEGHYQIPSRCTEEILSARLLNITLKQFKELCDVAGTNSLCKIGKLSEVTYQRVKGIGEKKAEHIKRVLNG
jgi:ERCC4-type nuclease